MRDIIIRKTGIDFETLEPTYTVDCGCRSFIFRDRLLLLQELERYMLNPQKAEREFNKRIGAPEEAQTGLQECEIPVPTDRVNR